MRKHLLGWGVLVLLGCGGASVSSVAGTWTTQNTIAGSGWVFTLAQNGATVTGSGEERIEAGPTRDFVLEGSLAGAHLTTTLTFTDDQTQATYAADVNGDAMSGSLTENGSSNPLDLVRQP